ncbi:MAG: hypothetical protein QXX79_04130, partial [Candidatus Bathyarchaeia archaeon]
TPNEILEKIKELQTPAGLRAHEAESVSESEEFNRLKRSVEACELGEIVEVQTRREALLVKLKINLNKK